VIDPGKRSRLLPVCLVACTLVATACAPKKYEVPQATLEPAYKENAAWKQAEPRDAVLRDRWWELFDDQQLNDLEAQVSVSNQTLQAAAAQFVQARAALRGVRSAQQPQVSAVPTITAAQGSGTRATTTFNRVYGDFLLPVDVSYEADVWARVRNAVNSSVASAQATAADVETVGLSLHAELAVDYFTLRGLDSLRELLETTVQAFERALELTQNRFQGGIASQADVALAETQLESTRAEAIDVETSRASLEHAIALLVGRPAGEFAIDRTLHDLNPPVVPVGVPSELLERRPDIASSERRVASANAQIGVATSALYPIITLSGVVGYESSSFGSWLSTASHFWSIAPAAAVNIFDAGRRRSIVDQANAAYDQATAVYRESVLSAFGEVEDQLATLRVLEEEDAVQLRAVDAAERSLTQANNRYRGGIVTYLEVIAAQSALLSNERAALNIRIRRMTATVQLMKALGGGWQVTRMPQNTDLAR
jgi:NodT family efflux transporter outer membrane factor (OMF) lipoprotein